MGQVPEKVDVQLMDKLRKSHKPESYALSKMTGALAINVEGATKESLDVDAFKLKLGEVLPMP